MCKYVKYEYGIYHDESFARFTMIVENEACVYIFFLALDERMRGQGLGAQTIRELSLMYREKQIVVDFEELDPKAANYDQRVRRKRFYLQNGFRETGRYTMLRGARFEVVCDKGELNAEGFMGLVKEIHRLLPVFPGILI